MNMYVAGNTTLSLKEANKQVFYCEIKNYCGANRGPDGGNFYHDFLVLS